MAQAVARTSSRFWYSSPVRRALATTSVGARPSFEASFAAPAATSLSNVSGPEHAEAPRLGQMVVRREARELEAAP